MKELDEFTQAFVAALLWSESGDDDEYLDSRYTVEDFAEETLACIVKECEEFQRANAADIKDRLARAGHDFALTRNHHGAGFWDGDWPEAGDRLTEAAGKFKEFHLYAGDDGKLYAESGG